MQDATTLHDNICASLSQVGLRLTVIRNSYVSIFGSFVRLHVTLPNTLHVSEKLKHYVCNDEKNMYIRLFSLATNSVAISMLLQSSHRHMTKQATRKTILTSFESETCISHLISTVHVTNCLLRSSTGFYFHRCQQDVWRNTLIPSEKKSAPDCFSSFS